MSRKILSPKDEQRVVALHKEGFALKAIADRFGCSRGTVWNVLHACGLTVFPSKGAPESASPDSAAVACQCREAVAQAQALLKTNNRNAIYYCAVAIEHLGSLGVDVEPLAFTQRYRTDKYRYVLTSFGRLPTKPPVDATERILTLTERLLQSVESRCSVSSPSAQPVSSPSAQPTKIVPRASPKHGVR